MSEEERKHHEFFCLILTALILVCMGKLVTAMYIWWLGEKAYKMTMSSEISRRWTGLWSSKPDQPSSK